MADINFLAKQVEAAVEAMRDEIIAQTQALVRIPSVAVTPGQEDCQNFMERKLREAGASIDRWIPDWEKVKAITYKSTGDTIYQTVEEQQPEYLEVRERVSVLAGTFTCGRPGKTLVFNGHIDLAGLGDPGSWTKDPYGGEIIDGRMYGRGTADQKGGVVASLYGIMAARQVMPGLPGVIHLLVTPEEETGGNGTAATIQRGYRGDAAIFTDISNNKLMISVCGMQKFRIDIKGKGGDMWHQVEGGDAVDALIGIVERLRAFENRRNAAARSIYGFAENETPACINIGFVQAGEWIASAPATARIEGLMAVLPNEDLVQLRKEFERTVTSGSDALCHAVAVVTFYPGKEGYVADQDEPVVQAMQQALTALRGRPEAPMYGNACSDMTYYAGIWGTPSIEFGPGEAKNIHCPDEYVEVEQLIEAAKAYALAIIQFLAGDEAP